MEKKTFVKAAKMLCNLDIIMLEQILDIEGLYLMTQQQLKISRKKSKKGKKAIQFKELEEKVLISKEKEKLKMNTRQV